MKRAKCLTKDKENRNPNLKRKLPMTINLVNAMKIGDKRKARLSNKPLQPIENASKRKECAIGAPSVFKNEDLMFYREYGQDYFLNMAEAMGKVENCLHNHRISDQLRYKMIIWIGEVFSFFKKTSNKTSYLRAISIFDWYLAAETEKLFDKEVHLIGMACIFISSKLEDVTPIPLREIILQVGKKRFSGNDILEKEERILKTLSFDISKPTEFDFLSFYAFEFLQEALLNKNEKSELIIEIIDLVLNLITNYSFRKYSQVVLAVASSIFIFSKNALIKENDFKFPVHLLSSSLIYIKFNALDKSPNAFKT